MEAARFQRYDSLMCLIDQASAISFDFFDTLFCRPLANPEDVFEVLGRQFGIKNFKAQRQAAQAEAFRRMTTAGRKEISLQQIYDCLVDIDESKRAKIMQGECDLESNLLTPNWEVLALLRSLLDRGKPVVITSDMYLPGTFFIDVLVKYNLAHLPLFISSDCNATKRDSGELFEVISNALNLPMSSILHIGDNELSDVKRAQERGLLAFHYRTDCTRSPAKSISLSTSVAYGLLQIDARHIPIGSYPELGFLYGGTASVGFLQWIKQQILQDEIDHLLFLARDGYTLERLARSRQEFGRVNFKYFMGSRVSLTLAAINHNNFYQFLPFLLSGSDGLLVCELLERIGVSVPSPKVMDDLGLSNQVRISPQIHKEIGRFLYAYRWEIIKVAQLNRRALYAYLRELGIREGDKVALVDVGWNGTTQQAFELAACNLVNLQTQGYYFCLADTPKRVLLSQSQRMKGLFTSETVSPALISKVYQNRVAVEVLFSAPHHTVIGLQPSKQGVEPILDPGRMPNENQDTILKTIEAINQGIECFNACYLDLVDKLQLDALLSPLETAWPLIELVITENGDYMNLVRKIKSFDAWGSSRNHAYDVDTYSVIE